MSVGTAPVCGANPGVFLAPLSFAQQRLWFLSQLHPKSCAYNVPFGLRIRGALDAVALHRALAYLVHRHEALRTTFREVDTVPQQVIAPGAAVSMDFTDLSTDAETGLKKLREEEASTPFDLEHGPLIRFRLARLATEEHVLLVTLHHIVSDGWSAGVIVREILTAYKQFVDEGAADLPELPIQYADFANWQHDFFTGQTLCEELDHWKKVLQGAPPILELPTEFPRPKERTFDGATEQVSLDPSLTAELQEFCRSERVTPFMFYTAAFNALLARYSGQTDIVLGTPIANRDRVELENLVGFVANTVLLRNQFALDQSFSKLLQTVRATSIDALAHQQLPFDKLVEELHPERSSTHNPLFQVLIGVYDNPSGSQEIAGLCVDVLDPVVKTSKFDLSLYIIEESTSTHFKLEYNTALYSRTFAQRILGHLLEICRAGIRAPETEIRKLPLLSDAERKQILHDWNATEAPIPNTTVHALFEEQATRNPNATALILEGRRVSYDELNRRANKLAHLLRARGVTRDTLVGVCMERSFEMVIALVGILKSGGAYVPIDPTYPSERLQFMLADAGVPVLLTQSHLRSKLVGYSGQIVALDACDEIAQFPSDNPPAINSPDDLIYCIYTSGSTGKPKGALNSHRGVANRLLWGQSKYPITSADKVLQKTPFSFDVSAWEFFWPLISGATLVIARPEGHKDPAYLAQLIRDEQITTVHFVPSMLQAFLNEPSAAACRSIQRVICSGEALPIESQEQFFKLFNCQLLNFYGPTEASIEVTFWECNRHSRLGFVPIGKPIANTQVYILNDAFEPCPALVPGELFIGGTGVARGYHHRPELTAEKFLSDPFRADNRLYRTGDLARFLPDGTIQYLGRIDHQVKIRGFRIELEEIESVLRQHPLIKDTVAIARELKGQQQLIAYYVPYPSITVEIESLRTQLRTQLPEYMVPTFFVPVREIPLNPNGKVDRRALPDPETSANRAESAYVPPRNDTEQKLAQIWCEVLRLEKAGINDNFFDLGGHSLLATQLVSRIKMNFDAAIPLSRFFELPTIAQLGDEISRARHAAKLPKRNGNEPSERLLAELDKLTPDQIEALLQKELS
ncbi:MAG TPA: amino acid adenylation domain-containing protein [Verrucomicrobiae bacterium]